MILCNPSLKLAKSLIMSGMCLGRFCSRSRLFAKYSLEATPRVCKLHSRKRDQDRETKR